MTLAGRNFKDVFQRAGSLASFDLAIVFHFLSLQSLKYFCLVAYGSDHWYSGDPAMFKERLGKTAFVV